MKIIHNYFEIRSWLQIEINKTIENSKENTTENPYSNEDILQYALSNGIINIDFIQEKIAMNERKKYLEGHQYAKWQGSNGKWYTYLPDAHSKNNRKLVKRTSEKSLNDAIVNYYKKCQKMLYIQDMFYLWLKEKFETFGEISKQTYDRYETDYMRFIDKSELSHVPFEHITENMLEHFIKTTIKNLSLSAKGWANLRTLLNGIFKYAYKYNHTQINIYMFLGNLDISRNMFRKVYKIAEEEVFTYSEVDLITKYIYDRPLTMIGVGIILAFQTGLRAGEIATLKYSDLKGSVLTVQRTEIRYKNPDGEYVFDVRESTKGIDGIRSIILTESAIKTIHMAYEMNPTGEYLFMRNGYRLKGKAFTNKIYRICDYLGIPKRSIHKARKTYGTKLLNAGLDEKLIESQMGHNDVQTTKGYYWYNNHETQEVQKVLSLAIG